MSCLAIVLTGPRAKNGRRVYDSFIEANLQCFWNRELVLAVNSLVYMGCMRPATLFVSASSENLQILRSAWQRRVLKPATGYQISSLGDMGAIQTVEQMHFVPLGDVLCDAIAQLNRTGQRATISSVRAYVAQNCPHVAPPGSDMVRQTVASLLTTGLVYRMGDHLFVSVPTVTAGQNAAVVLPQAPAPPKKKTTVECQTGTSILIPQPSAVEKKDRRSLLARLFSKKTSTTSPTSSAQQVAFSTQFTTPDWLCHPRLTQQNNNNMQHNKFPTFHDGLCEKVSDRKIQRKSRKCERMMSSSSECLNYGPIDPPECLPGLVEVIDTLQTRRKRRPRRKEPARTSTPIESDSAYSPSPVTDSNEEPGSGGSWSEPEEVKVDHTYINIRRHDSTQFESTQFEEPPAPIQPPPPPRMLHIVSNI